MHRGWLRVLNSVSIDGLGGQGKLTQREAASEMRLSERQVKRILKRHRQSGLSLESPTYQRRHPAWFATRHSPKYGWNIGTPQADNTLPTLSPSASTNGGISASPPWPMCSAERNTE